MRVLVAWCPDWSVTAGMFELAETAGTTAVASDRPAAVLSNNVVEVCNASARAEGVRRGQRRRDAQSRCPELLLLPANPERDVRYFEPVLATVEDLRPGVAPIRPGLLAVPAPGRFFGGERHAAALLAQHLVETGVWDCRFGVADDLFTAEQAARQADVQDCTVVPAGGSADFVQALPVRVLADAVDGGEEGRELADLLRRLGLTTLGDFARLSAAEVSNRFGSFGLGIWQRAQGGVATTLGSRQPPPELACEVGFEPPLESAEAVCFSVRRTAEQFVQGLAERQLVAVAVRIEAEFNDSGGVAVSSRTWLHPRCFTSRDLVDRVHWQLQAAMPSSGLRSRRDAGEIRAPVERVRFLPETVEPAADHAEGLWGGGADEQVTRGVARVQAMIGFDAVRTPVLQGGRSVADRQASVAWGERPSGLRPVDRPWPGRIPGPAPSRVFASALKAEVVDEGGRTVAVTERGAVTGEPWRYRIDAAADVVARRWTPIASWAGPWPVDDAWWQEAEGGGRSARFQVVGVDGRAWLLVWRATGWEAEAGYD